MRAGSDFQDKFCRRFHHVSDKLTLATLGAANSIRQRIGNAGAAMIR